MPSLTPYWIIVIALVAAGLAIWLLTREGPAKPTRRAPRARVPAAPATPVLAAESELEDQPAPDAVTPKRRGRKPKAGPPDPLTTLKGLGPKAASQLNALGVTRFDQIAAWTDADAAQIDAEMGFFRGRMYRDKWIEQAQHLAAGDLGRHPHRKGEAGFEAKFGKLG